MARYEIAWLRSPVKPMPLPNAMPPGMHWCICRSSITISSAARARYVSRLRCPRASIAISTVLQQWLWASLIISGPSTSY